MTAETNQLRKVLAAWMSVGVVFTPGAVPPGPVPVEREAPWRIADFAKDAGVQRRMVFDLAFETNRTAWFAVSDGLYRYDGYHWRRFTTADGLPSSFVRTVSVTRDGTIWVGTDKGTGVFDGARFDSRGTQGRLAGPNVRRIVETSDGSLWFCCDRWPDATMPGGLTWLKDGECRTFGLADGLPSDHLLSLFEQSNGRLIALTAKGPAVRQGETWAPLEEPGFPAGDHTWAMEETPDGLVFAQGSRTIHILENGQWRSGREEVSIGPLPFTVAADGVPVAARALGGDRVWFERWNGEGFTKASYELAGQAFTVSRVRAAPDGSVWAVGRGTIVRWEYLLGSWEWRPELPRPVIEDRQNRLWFAHTNGVAMIEGGQVREIPEMRLPVLEDLTGSIWSGGTTSVVRWIEGRIEPVPREVCGIARLQEGIVDASGVVWLRGESPDGTPVLSGFSAQGWKICGTEVSRGRRLSSMAADPQQGVWVVFNDLKTGSYELARITMDGVAVIPVEGEKPRTHGPSICVSRTHFYLYGYNGLWEAVLGERLSFTKVQADAGGVYTRSASAGDIAAFVVQEGVDGSAAILVRRPNEWLRHRVVYGQALWLGRDGWLMVADGTEFVLWQTREWTTPTYVALPTDTTVQAMLRTTGGDFWLGTSLGVLRLRPSRLGPDTVLTGPETLIQGGSVTVMANGVAPFAPRSQVRRYSFSWRLDSGPWCGYQDWPAEGVPLGNLAPGQHQFEARARDGLGNEDPTPAILSFVVRPIPIQDRYWFRPALAGMGLLFATLSLALYGVGRRLRKYAGRLEELVQARTAELKRDIERRRGVEKVQQAVAHISEVGLAARSLAEFFPAMHEVVAGLMPAKNLYVALMDRPVGEIQFPYFRDEKDTPPLPRKQGRGITEFVLESGKPLLASAERIRELAAQGRIASAGTVPVSWLGVPLRTQDHTLGVLVVQSYSEDTRYGEREREILMLLSYAVANAIERRRAEEALRESEILRRTVLDSLSASIAVLDPNGKIVAVNETWREFARQNGMSMLSDCTEGVDYLDVVRRSAEAGLRQAGEIVAGIEAVLSGRQPGYVVEYDCHSPAQQRWFVMQVLPLSGKAGGAVISHESITDRKRAETEREKLQGQLGQAQKMESVGRLAGGVAHDFNNMLQSILGNAALALEEVPPGSPLRESLEEIQSSAQRSADLTRQLLAFARKQTISPKVLDLNDTVGGMLRMLRRLIGEDIDLAWMPGASLWPVRMDPSQVDQILANLCVNARDAISGSGKVTIATQNVRLGDTDVAGRSDVVPGEYVVLSVSDDGHGMDADTRAHLFEPFFTTKEPGKGTGLGLATVFGIVQQNQGSIEVTSERGQGTTFRILLPRVLVQTSAELPEAVTPSRGGTETVLLVEDEGQILHLSRRILEQRGYTVLAAATPQAALTLASRHPGPIHLLITDVVMPGMNGKALFERLQASRGDLKCLFMSGYTANVIAHHGVLEEGVEFLQKPFTVEALAARVRKVLEAPGSV